VTDPAPVPFAGTILIDKREQRPYSFAGFHADARAGGVPLAVATRVVCLPTGDYSLEGYGDTVAVERKTLADAYATLGQGRDRFERELERLAQMPFAAVVIEADWRTIIRHPPAHSRLNPKTVYRSVIAWQQRFPNVHWWACPNRRFAEVTTLRVLERFLKDRPGCAGRPGSTGG
jgi:ERCC4-type nuclease